MVRMTTAERDATSAADAVLDALRDDPVIASVKDRAALDDVLASDRGVVFVLFGSVLDIAEVVQQAKDAGKTVLVDVDLLDGFSSREVVVTWLAANTRADGVLSTKSNLVRAARRAGLVAVQRFFLVDSFSYHQLPASWSTGRDRDPPGLHAPRDHVAACGHRRPVIAGGLVCDKADVVAALGAGAVAVASSNRDVWDM